MDYTNTETKLDQLVGYFNEEKINLSPIFQRNRVWPLKMRRELMKNIVRHRPIPAIFLYKDEAGSKYSYNILDGKQRLESILMFIGGDRNDFAIKTWDKYIFGPLHRADVGFGINLGDTKKKLTTFAMLDEKTLRDLREYPIPTIEIALNEKTNLDEMISLFVDINQYGEKVTRLDIVKAMKQKEPLLKDVFGLVAVRQRREQDTFLRSKRKSPYVPVLKRLQLVASIADPNAQVDRMWEKLFELALFTRSGKHRKPAEILKTFIKAPATVKEARLTSDEKARLHKVFSFLREAYGTSALGDTALATDQTHFYTMATALLGSDLLTKFPEDVLVKKLTRFGRIIDGKESRPRGRLRQLWKKYEEVSSKQTTDVSRRDTRLKDFVEIITQLPEVETIEHNGATQMSIPGTATA